MGKNTSEVIESNERGFTSFVDNEVWEVKKVTCHSIIDLFERAKKFNQNK